MKKRALLVGINYTGSGNDLKGCINDSNNMNAMLISQGFSEIKMLLEKNATTAEIIAGLNWLVTDIAPGDVIVFHYSGHGSQLPSAKEADGFEEIICPIDLNWMDKVITDDTLRNIFGKVPNGVNTTVILDCCHSGTMLDQTESLAITTTTTSVSKSVADSRYMTPPPGILQELSGRDLVDWETSRDVNSTALLIAGCQANQTSADAYIAGVYQGAATYALLRSVTTSPDISYKNLVIEMNQFMSSNGYSQRPALDGSPLLYNEEFLKPWSVFGVAPVSTAPLDIYESSDDEAEDQKKNNNERVIAIALVVVAAIALFFLL